VPAVVGNPVHVSAEELFDFSGHPLMERELHADSARKVSQVQVQGAAAAASTASTQIRRGKSVKCSSGRHRHHIHRQHADSAWKVSQL
jgi:hypothetical protein